MTKPQIKIDVVECPGADRPWAEIQVEVDGDVVIEGRIGGEPEDNTIFRDYAWVVPALTKLSQLAGDVQYVHREV